MEEGYIKGEICNRNGCTGTIDEHDKEGCCSCHINPPCSYCTTDTSYCPLCGWDVNDDFEPIVKLSNAEIERYRKEQEERELRNKLFYEKLRGVKPIDKLEIRTETHTHFTQKRIGIFPPGTETRETIRSQVRGTFGGRFEYFDSKIGKFCFIAYTD